jgi:Co/Zn/Cd efflux system component
MAHNHRHTEHGAHRAPSARAWAVWAYGAASALGIIALIVQTRGVYGSHSTGLLADTFHLSADVWFNIVSCIALFRSRENEEAGKGPGWMLLTTGILSIPIGVWKFYNPTIADTEWMLEAAATGLILNVVMFVILQKFAGGGHSHAHGHAHHEANLDHLFADTVSSILVTIAAGGMFLFPSVKNSLAYSDPILTVLIGLLLIRMGWKRV